jgi:hypothetical protein
MCSMAISLGFLRFARFPQFPLALLVGWPLPSGGTQPDGMTGSQAGTVRHMVG